MRRLRSARELGVFESGWSSLLTANADRVPDPGLMAGGWRGVFFGAAKGGVRRSSPGPAAAPPLTAPGWAARQAPVSRSRPPPALAAR